jgi:hypothetical protein
VPRPCGGVATAVSSRIYLLAAGVTVEHILDMGKVEPARLTPGAEIRSDGSVLYRAATLL